MFAVAIVALSGMVALVIDVSYYWSASLRVQRAADAAALAGVVWLPGTPAMAYSTALDEAKKDGYIVEPGTTITPLKDPTNDRRLNVTIDTSVGTFFMKIFGINSIPVLRTAKAEFVLPVPMGSPQNYYGVGFFEGLVAGTAQTIGPAAATTGVSTAPDNQFTNPNDAFGASSYGSDNQYATGTVGQLNLGQTQAYANFGLTAPAGNSVEGIEIRIEAKASDPAGCNIVAELSKDNGVTWSNTSNMIAVTGTDPGSGSWRILGSPTDLWGLSWVPGDIVNGKLQVRLKALDPESTDDASNTNSSVCNNNATISVDAFNITVYSRTARVKTVLSVNDPITPFAPLAPQNIWGAMFTSGGTRENGDRYGPSYLGNNAGGAKGDPNPVYNPDGYDYTIELSGGATNGAVQLFDPMFCATGDNGHGGSFGAGDHWTDHPPSQVLAPVAITYRLYNMNGTPLDGSDDTLIGSLAYDPGTKTMGDFSGSFGTPTNSTDPNRQDCSTNPAHNEWVTLASGLPGGMYRVNVNTTIDAGNLGVGAENLFSIHVNATGGKARVYGGGRMAAYANMDAATGLFYLAQIEAAHAGKTMVIKLFDPGESSGDAFLRIKSPDGNSYNNVNFTWTSDDGRSGSGTQIQTSVGGAAQFNNKLLTILIPLPSTYGSTGLTPSGETEPGWWKIEYQMSAANDTTTWEVSINGNPVHLLLP
jgi:Flp pilus assembly protein TadG